jgi:hypothetical protein
MVYRKQNLTNQKERTSRCEKGDEARGPHREPAGPCPSLRLGARARGITSRRHAGRKPPAPCEAKRAEHTRPPAAPTTADESTLPAHLPGGCGGGRRGGGGGRSGVRARPAAARGRGGHAAERTAGRPVAAAGAAEVARLPHVVVVEVAELGLPAAAPRARQRLAAGAPGPGRLLQGQRLRRGRRRRRRRKDRRRRRRGAIARGALRVGGLDDLAEELEPRGVGVRDVGHGWGWSGGAGCGDRGGGGAPGG